ncbi:MAG: IS701 family transposase [Betaproteobacteria bacterium]|nr:IS701 family transposase [Betaproteobacteria bacterium]
MNLEEFERVAASFAAFHQEFAPLFGRTEARERSEQYLRGLLVQQTDRRNAENLAETIEGATPRSLQRFLTESPWDDGAVIARLQRYVGQRLNQRDGVLVLDDTGFAKQGKKSVGVARQYSGTLGKVGNCQVGVFLAYVSARGHALVDKALYLPPAWTADRPRCRAAGVPEAVGYQSKAELGLALVRRAQQAGHLTATWVTGDSGYGEVPTLRDTLDAEGWCYVLEVPSITPVFTQAAQVAVPAWSGRGRKPTQPQLLAGEPGPQTVQAVAASLAPTEWHELTVAEGAQGPRSHQFAALRVWESRAGLPGRACWLVLRRDLDGSEAKYYLSNAPADTPLLRMAQVGAMRWPVETEFQTEKGETGLDEYEVRTWLGWQHHITMALLAGAFLLSLQLDWGEKAAPDHATADHTGATAIAAATHLDAG